MAIKLSTQNKTVLGGISLLTLALVIIRIWSMVIILPKFFEGNTIDLKNFTFTETESNVLRASFIIGIIYVFGLSLSTDYFNSKSS